ncbi:MAG TPA: hypothetical protein VL486_06475 [Verrucomicrobiae bacterium]|nr:hypothetical protein [Verrucomicrobiae bacterium]
MDTNHPADAIIGNTVIAVKTGMEAVSSLRTSLIQLAYDLTEQKPEMNGLLVLVDPKITEERLAEEWQYARRALQKEVMDRLGLVVFRGNQCRGFPNDPVPAIRSQLETVLQNRMLHCKVRVHSGVANYEIFKILLHQWLLNKGPMTALLLAQTAGYTYPTVRDAVQRLGSAIKRHSDRRIELAYFPRDEFARLLAVSDRVRTTTRFTDCSGQPRSPEGHLRRLEKLNVPDIAIGGVIGARHYHPDLDLIGSPRLDLSLHCPGKQMNLGFIERLDPALQQVDDPHGPANVVVHAIRHANPLFQPRDSGLHWADPVECLLDLHEMRLESQACEFLNSFPPARGKT